MFFKTRSTDKEEQMELEQLKYQTCPFDEEEGVLLTDLEEEYPQTDANGNLQYYCLNGRHMFTFNEQE
ncbi:MAG: hypothetical protein IMW89_01560 [Ktedonobacteraceae bacterium]|nr:hypothetical protein [Ktedonobacteraceae bacterium]